MTRVLRGAARGTGYVLPALAGVASAAVAIAVSELLAGVVRGLPSLVIAVGDLVVSLQPPGAKDVVVELFGTNDKLALNVIIVGAALIVAALVGILARIRFEIGAVLFAMFGLLAGIAAAREPQGSPAVAAAIAALAVGSGLVTLRLLLDRLPRAAPSASEAATAEAAMPDWGRRRFLIASAGTLGAAAVVGSTGRLLLDRQQTAGIVATSRLPAALQPIPSLAPDQALNVRGITSLVVPNADFYRIDTALLVPSVDPLAWRLRVSGMVDHPLTFTYDQLLAMPLFEQYVTIACVSNKVGEGLVGNALWTGVRLKEVLRMAGVQAGATQIVGRSVDDFTVGFPTSWATKPEREPMIAVGMNRDVLPPEHGFPARLIVPGLFGYVSATKWLTSIELTTREAVDGYWIPLGWAKDGPILTQSRIDVPRGGQTLAVGAVEVAGVAWAPDRGIERLQLKIDDGDWQDARLSRPISPATWVQWEVVWPATAGRHALEVRATDGTGVTQGDLRTNPAPDGARGHHRIFVDVH